MANKNKTNTVHWVRKIRTFDSSLQNQIVQYLKNDTLIQQLIEKETEQEELLLEKTSELNHLRTVCEMIDEERHYVRELNHQAFLENMQLKRRLARLRSRISRLDQDVARQLNFDDNVETTE